jgi:hypothetical protein
MHLHRLFCIVCLCLLPLMAWGQGQLKRGEYTVHYSALPTLMLTPEVARSSGVTRSASRALLTISVQHEGVGASAAVVAEVSAAATNLNGQRQDVPMREVREGEAIYYLGEPRIDDGGRLDFEIDVTPLGADAPIRVTFDQRFHNPTQ